MSSAICFSFDQSKILSSGNGWKENEADKRKSWIENSVKFIFDLYEQSSKLHASPILDTFPMKISNSWTFNHVKQLILDI